MSADPQTGDPYAQRAAEEAQLAAMSATDMMLQSAVLLLNIGGRRLGLAPPSASAEELAAARADRDLEQVRDAIDAVRGLLEVLERRVPSELRPLRDALSQLQMAYAREVQRADAGGVAGGQEGESEGVQQGAPAGAQEGASPGEPPVAGEQGQRRPGPAESSGRLWVPGR